MDHSGNFNFYLLKIQLVDDFLIAGVHKSPEDSLGRSASEKKIDLERRSSVVFFSVTKWPQEFSTALSKSSTSPVSGRWISAARISVSPMEQIRYYCRLVVQSNRFHSDKAALKLNIYVDWIKKLNYGYHHRLDFILRNESCTEPSEHRCNSIACREYSSDRKTQSMRSSCLLHMLPHTTIIFVFQHSAIGKQSS